MKHPQGQGRIYTKDITYTTPGKRVKDYGIKASSLPSTPGLEAVAGSQVEPRPFAPTRSTKGKRTK